MRPLLAMATTLLVGCSSATSEAHALAPPTIASAPRVASEAATAAPVPTASPAAASAAGAGGCHARGVLPDPACTPGVADPRVTADNIATTICRRGYTRTVRPPVSYTEPLKRQQMLEYGFVDSISAHEEDHLIPLELGGHPTDPRNLWPEPGASPNAKDEVENHLHSLVCAGAIGLAAAQKAIATDWTTAVASLGA